jgi:hypothetical protein
MRLVAWLLIIVSLVVAVVSAVTAYSPKLTLPDQKLHHGGEPLTLGAPAGKHLVEGKDQPIAKPGDKLTPELLAQLRAADLRRVRVKEFSFARWSEWWIFALGSLGMLCGAMLMRVASAWELQAATEGAASPEQGAESALQQLRQELGELRRQLTAASDGDERLRLIDTRVERMISEHVPPFLAARALLVSRLGLAGYAQLMDHFAAAERQLNRAWSAAADGYEQDAVECLQRGALLLDEAAQKM